MDISRINIHKSNCNTKAICTEEFNKFFKIIDCPNCKSQFAIHIKEILTSSSGMKYVECISCHKNIFIN